MTINWTVVTIAGALLVQGAAVVWAVSAMVLDIRYNRMDISEMRMDASRLGDEIHENDIMIARIDANVTAIKDALNVVTFNHSSRD